MCLRNIEKALWRKVCFHMGAVELQGVTRPETRKDGFHLPSEVTTSDRRCPEIGVGRMVLQEGR